MALVDVTGQAHQGPARVGPPVRGEQPGEGRHEVRPAVVRHAARQRVRSGVVGLLDLVDAQDDALGAACSPTALAVQ